MEHVTHEGKTYELSTSFHPGSWDEHVGVLIEHEGRDYLVRQIVLVKESTRPKRLAGAFFKSLATFVLTFQVSKMSAHWEGAWSGKQIRRVAHKIDV